MFPRAEALERALVRRAVDISLGRFLDRMSVNYSCVLPDFGATFASSQVDGSAARKCFHYA